MKQHLVPYTRVGVAAVERKATAALAFVVDHFLLLPIGVLIALAWANTAGESYFRFAHALRFSVNDIGMAFFVGLITEEALEAVMPGGALYRWRRTLLPVVAAIGGVLGATATYVWYLRRVPVFIRQVDIAHQRVGPLHFEYVKRFASRRQRVHAGASLRQHQRRQCAPVGVVIDDQDAQPNRAAVDAERARSSNSVRRSTSATA